MVSGVSNAFLLLKENLSPIETSRLHEDDHFYHYKTIVSPQHIITTALVLGVEIQKCLDDEYSTWTPDEKTDREL